MKNIIYIICLFTISIQAQIEVTTVSAEIKGSGGLSLDEDGNLIIADFGDFLSVPDPDGLPNDIHIMDPDLNITQYSTGFIGASGNDFDSNGILFQSDIRASAIYKIIGGVSTFVTSTGIVGPVGIVFDSQDNFYVCNCGNNTIRKVTPGGVSTNFAPSGLYQCPNGITIDEDDNLYVSNFNNGNILKITPAGVVSVLNDTPGGSTGGPSNGHLDYFEPTRTLFIASHGSNKIYMMPVDDPSDLVAIAGSGIRGNADGDATTASFSRPNGVAVTKTGDSIFINSAVPVTNIPNGPLNPQLIRLITGVNSILSVNDTEDHSNLMVYPNPATDRFTLEVKLADEYSDLNIKIYDIHGRIVKETTKIIAQGMQIKKNIEVSNLTSGNYFYSLNTGSKQILNGKIIIQ